MKNSRHIILTYHKVGKNADAISPNLFKLHLFIIRCFFNYLSIPDALQLSENSNLPKNSISISFDDGYSSFFKFALPAMMKEKFKPTLFLSSGYLNHQYMWNDLAEINGLNTNQVKYLTLKERNAILKNSSINAEDPLMTINEFKQIVDKIDIGGHTLDHPILALESEFDADYQISMDRENINRLTNGNIFLFAYPNGKYEKDFNDNTIELVKKSGYKYAFTTEPYRYQPDIFHRFIIPRISSPINGFLSSIKFFLSLYFKNMSPKVIMFESGNGFGGAALSAFEINQTFPRSYGVDLKLCISSLSGKYSIFKEIKNTDIIRFSKVDWQSINNSFQMKLKFLRNSVLAITYLLKEKPELVYLNNDPYNNLHIVIACKLLKIKYIIHHRGIVNSSLITKFVIRNALVNVVISKSVQDRVLSVDSSVKTQLIYNGFTPIENSSVISKRPDRLLMIGGFYGWKGQNLVLEAFDSIAKLNQECTIEFVGLSDTLTTLEIEFLNKVKLSNFSNRIKVSKFTNEISKLICESDIIIHASTEPEPFGRVVVEGMSAKRIVIASNIGGPSEIIEHGKNGFLFDPFNKNSLIDIFKDIYSENINLEEISKNAYTRSTEFNKYKNSNAICKLIKSHLKSYLIKY